MWLRRVVVVQGIVSLRKNVKYLCSRDVVVNNAQKSVITEFVRGVVVVVVVYFLRNRGRSSGL